MSSLYWIIWKCFASSFISGCRCMHWLDFYFLPFLSCSLWCTVYSTLINLILLKSEWHPFESSWWYALSWKTWNFTEMIGKWQGLTRKRRTRKNMYTTAVMYEVCRTWENLMICSTERLLINSISHSLMAVQLKMRVSLNYRQCSMHVLSQYIFDAITSSFMFCLIHVWISMVSLCLLLGNSPALWTYSFSLWRKYQNCHLTSSDYTRISLIDACGSLMTPLLVNPWWIPWRSMIFQLILVPWYKTYSTLQEIFVACNHFCTLGALFCHASVSLKQRSFITFHLRNYPLAPASDYSSLHCTYYSSLHCM